MELHTISAGAFTGHGSVLGPASCWAYDLARMYCATMHMHEAAVNRLAALWRQVRRRFLSAWHIAYEHAVQHAAAVFSLSVCLSVCRHSWSAWKRLRPGFWNVVYPWLRWSLSDHLHCVTRVSGSSKDKDSLSRHWHRPQQVSLPAVIQNELRNIFSW